MPQDTRQPCPKTIQSCVTQIPVRFDPERGDDLSVYLGLVMYRGPMEGLMILIFWYNGTP